MLSIFRTAITGGLAALATAVIALPAVAQTLPFEPVVEETDWRIDIGGGMLYGFDPGGGATDELNFSFWGSASYKDRLYANGLDGLGYNVIKTDRLRAGLQLRPAYGGESDLDGLEIPGLGADATAYAFTRLPGNVVVGGRLQQDVTDTSGGLNYTGLVSHQQVTPVGLLQLTGYARGGNADRNNAYLGVTQEEADATDLAFYEPGSGLTAAGAAAFLAFPLFDHYAVGSFVNYERAIDVGADSPLILRSKNEEDTFRFGLFAVRRFESAN